MGAFMNDNGLLHKITGRHITMLTVLSSLAVYVPAIKSDFFSDDKVYVVGNTVLQSIPLSKFWKFFFTRTNPYEFLPLRDLSYRIDIALWGEKAMGFHLHNIALYGLCCLFVWLLTSEIFRLTTIHTNPVASKENTDQQIWLCALTTCLFAVHPAHVESVAWISGRKDLLSAMFAMASLWQFAKGVNQSRIYPLCLTWAYIFYACALLSKASVITLPGVSFLLAYACLKRRYSPVKSVIKAVVLVVPLVCLSLSLLWITLNVGRATGIQESIFVQELMTGYDHIGSALKILALLAKLTVLPFWTRLIYEMPETRVMSVTAIIVGGVLLTAAGWGALLWIRKKSISALGVFWFVLCCVPFLQLISFRTWSLVHDRFVFLAGYGLVLAFASLVMKLSRPPRKVISLVVVLIFFLLTANQAFKWRSVEDLVLDTARKSPDNVNAQLMVIKGVYLKKSLFENAEVFARGIESPYLREMITSYVRAEEALARNAPAEALRIFGSYLQFVDTTQPDFLLFSGTLEEANGHYLEAVKFYYQQQQLADLQSRTQQAEKNLKRVRGYYSSQMNKLLLSVKDDPENIDTRGALANLQLELFKLDESMLNYKVILRLKPGLPPALYNLGLALLAKGEFEKAAEEIQKAVSGGFRTADVLNNLAIAQQKGGAIAEAEATFLEAIELDPANVSPQLNLIQMYYALDDNEKARELLLRILGRNIGNPEVSRIIRLAFADLLKSNGE